MQCMLAPASCGVDGAALAAAAAAAAAAITAAGAAAATAAAAAQLTTHSHGTSEALAAQLYTCLCSMSSRGSAKETI